MSIPALDAGAVDHPPDAQGPQRVRQRSVGGVSKVEEPWHDFGGKLSFLWLQGHLFTSVHDAKLFTSVHVVRQGFLGVGGILFSFTSI